METQFPEGTNFFVSIDTSGGSNAGLEYEFIASKINLCSMKNSALLNLPILRINIDKELRG